MRKIIVFKHVAQENLGALAPVLKNAAFRIRYVNFGRDPEAKPSMEKYQGLVVLGGWMGVYERDRYPHIQVECQLIEAALKRGIPVLGICLGAQILAHVLGSNVRQHTEREVGWQDIQLSKLGKKDPLLSHFQSTEKIFQMHGDTFDIPAGAVHLASSSTCSSQAFRYGEKAYGLQFHLEVDEAMIGRFLDVESNRTELEEFAGAAAVANLESETKKFLPHSLELSEKTFGNFIDLFGLEKRSALTNSGHGRDK